METAVKKLTIIFGSEAKATDALEQELAGQVLSHELQTAMHDDQHLLNYVAQNILVCLPRPTIKLTLDEYKNFPLFHLTPEGEPEGAFILLDIGKACIGASFGDKETPVPPQSYRFAISPYSTMEVIEELIQQNMQIWQLLLATKEVVFDVEQGYVVRTKAGLDSDAVEDMVSYALVNFEAGDDVDHKIHICHDLMEFMTRNDISFWLEDVEWKTRRYKSHLQMVLSFWGPVGVQSTKEVKQHLLDIWWEHLYNGDQVPLKEAQILLCELDQQKHHKNWTIRLKAQGRDKNDRA